MKLTFLNAGTPQRSFDHNAIGDDNRDGFKTKELRSISS
ncbi:hypothetical protein AH06_71 [Erwinia phage AH06]|nr:hypothetical protein AH06_71 [Erwinia phage AH06]